MAVIHKAKMPGLVKRIPEDTADWNRNCLQLNIGFS